MLIHCGNRPQKGHGVKGMKTKITRELLRDIKPTGKTVDIYDTDIKGFIVRILPSGTMTYVIRYSSGAGVQVRYSLGKSYPTTSISEGREAARILLGKIAAGENPADERKALAAGKLTLFSFIDGDYGNHLRSKTKTAAATIFRLKKCFGQFKDRPLTEIDAVSIDRWRAAKIKTGMTASTVNRDIGALKPLFSRAVEWKLLPENPLKLFKPIKSDADPIVRFLSDVEETSLRTAMDCREIRDRDGRARANLWRTARHYEVLPALDGSRFVDYLKPAVLLSINTGIRQGELIGLLWSDVNLGKDASLFVRGESSKNNKGRHVPLNDEAKAVIAQWKEQQGDTALVFPGRDGKRIAEVKTAWRKLLSDAEIIDFRWHDMRHHFASRLVMAGVDLNTVRELLGHSDLKMTLRYAHLAPEHKAAAVQKLMRKL